MPNGLVDAERLFHVITGTNVYSINLEQWCRLGLEHVETVSQCPLFRDSAGQETLQLLMPGTCCQCLAPAELNGVRKVLVGDTTGFLEVSQVRKAWPQLGLSASTVDADLTSLQAKAADAAEEDAEARAAEEDAAIDRLLGLEAGDVDNDEEQPGPVAVAAETRSPRGRPLRQKVLDDIQRLQRSTSFLMPKICVARVVNDITKNIVREEAERAGKDPADVEPYRFSTEALEVIQTALEGYLTDFADLNALAHHAKRVTVQPEDARLHKRLRRE